MAKKQIPDIPEIGIDGLNYFRKVLKFGDIIENGWASTDNPNRFGIVVNPRSHSIMLTDGNKNFWDLIFDAESCIKLHGNTLNENYAEIKRSYNE